MAKLKEYNGYYCESEYEYAFLDFLKKKAGTISLAARFPVSAKMMF